MLARIAETIRHDDIHLSGAQEREHPRQAILVVLEIAVDHGDEIGAGRQPALDHRPRQPRAVDAPEAAHTRIAARDLIGHVIGAIGGIVVHDDHLPGQPFERRDEALEQPTPESDEQLLRIDDALRDLATSDTRRAQTIELVYFGGLSRPEVAAALAVSEGTVDRDLRLARAWLKTALGA